MRAIKNNEGEVNNYQPIKKLLLIIISICCQAAIFAENVKIDSLQSRLQNANEDSSKVHILLALASNLTDIADYESAINYTNEALALSSKIDFTPGISEGYNILANIVHYQGNYTKALEYYFKALEINEKLGDKNNIALLLGNIGLIYSDQNSYTKALEYYNKALEIYHQTKDNNGIALNLGNIGNIYNFQGKYDTALQYYFQCIELNNKEKNYREKAINLNNIAIVYCVQGNLDKGLNTFFESLEIRKQLGDKRGMELTLGNIGDIFLEQKKYEKAQKYFEQALEIAKTVNDLEGIMLLNQSISRLYEKQNLWQQSLMFHKQFTDARDSLLNSIKSKQMAEMQTKYETEKKDKQLIKKDAETKQKSMERNMFLIGFVIMALFAGFIFRSWRLTNKQKAIIEEQKKEVELQKHIVEEKNQDISDSINYARRIQSSFLTSETYIKKYLQEYFILYTPRDIVSGDFYWVSQQEKYLYFCVADCTGHGIPGAFMSLIGMSLLNEIVLSKKIRDTNAILDELRRLVIMVVNPEGSTEVAQDGMDLFLGRLDLTTKQLQYSAANNSFYIYKNGEFVRYKPDKMPVGSYGEYEKPFTANYLELKAGDIIYSSTDGYRDQFGGPDENKYMSSRFERFISSIAEKPLPQQKMMLENEFNAWKGKYEQVDDICVMGIKIT